MCGKISEYYPYDPHAGAERVQRVKDSSECLVREQGERRVCSCKIESGQKSDMLIVKKFGGSSVANKERIFRVAERCIEEYKKGNDVVVVLSAMGDTTDELLAKAADINPNAPKRELDMLLTTGEQVSVSLMAMAMHALGVPAVSLNAYQVMMHSTSRYGNARFKRIDSERIRHELDSRKIVIVTGFQGVNKYDDYTTLGRGGSDTTAVALAAALRADACEIYTDVDGVYTADPRVVKNARKLKEITYDEMLELATSGAKVLHNRSVEMAKKYGVQLVVRSSMNLEEGTTVKEVAKMEKMLISGDIILQSVGREGTKNISFTVSQEDLKPALAILEEYQEPMTIREIKWEDTVAKISIVGAGMMSNPGVAAKLFESLYNNGININMISTSEIRITVLIDEKEIDKAMQAVHDGFGLGDV